MTALAAALATLLIWVDGQYGDRWLDLGWTYSGSAEGARQLLATVAGSMITVAGVVFSVMIVALSLASSQFGPRLLGNYMRDRGNQIVLGTFIATFVYCLLVLRTVRGEDGGDFVPQLSISGAVLLTLASVAVLIFFLHHAAMSVQAPQIIANVSGELQRSIDTMFPDELGKPASCDDVLADREISTKFNSDARPVFAKSDGYVQAINNERLLEIATKEELIVEVLRRPGQFTVAGVALARYWPGGDSELDEQVRGSFILGPRQTSEQDVEFVVNQLVEVAVRALSPGINDPFTAFNCLDHLGAALSRLAGRRIPTSYRRDDKGKLRVIARPVTLPELAENAFGQIRRYGSGKADVLGRMLEVIGLILPQARREEDRTALLHESMLVRDCAERLADGTDRNFVLERHAALLQQQGIRRNGNGVSSGAESET
jgi:uncharacterized membrane protein